MIRITEFAPPAQYQQHVKERGERFLRRNPSPTSIEFGGHDYWRAILDDLHNLYGGVCSYCASWTPRTSSDYNKRTSVDHFIPKSIVPSLAYEWKNFRLCRSLLNHRKSSCLEVMDPVSIVNGWFTLDFATFLIKPANSIPPWVTSRIVSTVDVLELNGNDYVRERLTIIKEYSLSGLTIQDLRTKYPFIADQMSIQNFDGTLKASYATYFSGR